MKRSRRIRAIAAMRRVVDLALVLFVASVLGTIIVGQVVPQLGGAMYVVGGPSMVPALPVGAAIVATPVDPATLRVGDVVTMKVGPAQAVFTHRIVRIVDREGAIWIETKGDANAEVDPSILPATVVIGRVDTAIPGLGYLIALLSMPTGVLFAVALAGSLFAIAWLLEALEEDAAEAVVGTPVDAESGPPRSLKPARSLSSPRSRQRSPVHAGPPSGPVSA